VRFSGSARSKNSRRLGPWSFGPDLVHLRQHGPIDEGHEVRAGEPGGEFIRAKSCLDVFPVHLAEGLVFAQHDFAVLELQGVGVAWFSDRMHLGPLLEVGEDRMKIGITQVAKIRDLGAETGQCVGHDWAVAAQFGDLTDEFDVRALARGGFQPARQLGDGGEAQVFIRAFAFVHDVEDFVHKPVEADERFELAGARGGS